MNDNTFDDIEHKAKLEQYLRTVCAVLGNNRPDFMPQQTKEMLDKAQSELSRACIVAGKSLLDLRKERVRSE